MKLKILLKLLFLVIWFGYSNAQEVVASGGHFFHNSTHSVTFTIGEPSIETLVSSGNILTQGFNQSRLIVTALNQLTINSIQLKVYPNPVKTSLRLDISNIEKISLMYRLFDADGKLLSVEKVQSENQMINMQPYTAGNYLLYVSGIDGKPVQTFKIVKN